MAEWLAGLTITPEFVRTQRVGVAEQAGAVMGFYSLRREAGQWHLEHLWLCPAHMGHGHGRLLYAEAVRQAHAEGATELHIAADPNAEPFYLKMGAVRTGVEIYQLPGRHRRELPRLRHKF